ncbi:hypothetical protein COW46_03645 [Candidatus Gracilibacteria bacterium CG17_big_fil_post_rev_8_21_14_2_50_48_13]|nr:MAG: hypothetical protein COW46_03645 [Candidatus Gracilibacteria bacterium CG17_big_fil_post_rev_8_21_14_2_50_48_13]
MKNYSRKNRLHSVEQPRKQLLKLQDTCSIFSAAKLLWEQRKKTNMRGVMEEIALQSFQEYLQVNENDKTLLYAGTLTDGINTLVYKLRDAFSILQTLGTLSELTKVEKPLKIIEMRYTPLVLNIHLAGRKRMKLSADEPSINATGKCIASIATSFYGRIQDICLTSDALEIASECKEAADFIARNKHVDIVHADTPVETYLDPALAPLEGYTLSFLEPITIRGEKPLCRMLLIRPEAYAALCASFSLYNALEEYTTDNGTLSLTSYPGCLDLQIRKDGGMMCTYADGDAALLAALGQAREPLLRQILYKLGLLTLRDTHLPALRAMVGWPIEEKKGEPHSRSASGISSTGTRSSKAYLHVPRGRTLHHQIEHTDNPQVEHTQVYAGKTTIPAHTTLLPKGFRPSADAPAFSQAHGLTLEVHLYPHGTEEEVIMTRQEFYTWLDEWQIDEKIVEQEIGALRFDSFVAKHERRTKRTRRGPLVF